MTEYERFIKIHIGTPYEYVIKDINNNKTYGMFKGDDKAVIQLLKTINELNEENEGLKHHISELQGQNEILTKENEKLKKRLSDLQKENYGNIDGVAFYQEENATLCEKISDLKYENEKLKKENKELKTSKEYWREKCLSKDSYNKLYHKAPIWFTQSAKLTDKQANEIAEAINQSLKERRIKK